MKTMKKLLLLLLVFAFVSAEAQPNKNAIDSVSLKGNILYQYSKGVEVVRGSVGLDNIQLNKNTNIYGNGWGIFLHNVSQFGVGYWPTVTGINSSAFGSRLVVSGHNSVGLNQNTIVEANGSLGSGADG